MRLMHFLHRSATHIKTRFQFSQFERKVHPATWETHDSILEWALTQAGPDANQYYLNSPVVQRGHELRSKVLSLFKNKYGSLDGVRILIHIPSKDASPGGFSLFSNLLDSIKYLGVPCELLEWEEPIDQKLTTFYPTIFLTSDHEAYLNRIDWNAVQRYRLTQPLRVGLTASIEAYGNSPVVQRLRWAKAHGVNFYYSFRSPEYLHSREDYQPFFSEGFQIYSVEFGANPFHYYPVGGFERDLSYVFLASSNPDKQRRYTEWATSIVSRHAGFLDGPGWSKIDRYSPNYTHRFLYGRAKVGINLHIDDSIDWASELNERTYILAACGVPQLIDNPKLLGSRFCDSAMFQANSPKEYFDLFCHILDSPEDASARVIVALEEVYSKYTTFHRAEEFLTQLIGR